MLARIAVPVGVLAGLAGVVSVVSCAGQKDNGPAEARLASLVTVTVKGDEAIRVPFALTNPSKGTVVYSYDPDETGLYNLQGLLYQNGEMIKEDLVLADRPLPKKEQLRKLKPGECVILHFTLPYGTVKPGRYELRLTYDIPPKSTFETDLGLTPMKLEQTILLDLRKE
jgi:hypothetical protein